MKRRLAAVLIAEVADYARHFGETEADAHTALEVRFRGVTDPKIYEHHGRIVKAIGDSVLAEFANVLDAVKCGLEVQRESAKRDATVPGDERLEFSIGINHGLVVIEGDGIYGAVVGIAARLSTLAGPGGICISGTAFDQVEDKLDVGFELLSEHKPGSFSELFRGYRVLV